MKRMIAVGFMAMGLSAQTQSREDMIKEINSNIAKMLALKQAEEDGIVAEANLILEICQRHPEEAAHAYLIITKVQRSIDKAQAGSQKK